MASSTYPLWSDEPATEDLLSFRAVAETAADAIFDDALDPVAIGLSGSWGSGKTSVLELLKAEISKRSSTAETKVLVISTQPWSYDPALGPKESLIAEVLGALRNEFKEEDPIGKAGLDAFNKLVRKVNWSKALKITARTAVTMQLPSIDDVMNLVSDDPESLESDKGMTAFRDEFGSLLADPALAHLSRVVVLVDDLDRCLPETVVETLEAIRLFLSAKGMSFVIAADEDRVADAIQQKFNTPAQSASEETPAKLYLHKIVQTTIPLPALSRFDTEAYLFLLMAKAELGEDESYSGFVAKCDDLRINGGSLDDIELDSGSKLAGHLVTATRLTPILYEKFHGNPRRIKRFLNDLNVRQAVASRRGFTLKPEEVAKLMVLERILEDDFRTVLDWLASNQLRDKLEALDLASKGSIPNLDDTNSDSSEGATPSKKRPSSGSEKAASAPSHEHSFSDTLLRWAKLPPSLDSSAISGYLYLAASFAKIEVIDTGLPERLRDLAVALTSSNKLDRAGVTDQTIKSLPEPDVRLLVIHLGRRTRDQPSIQNFSVGSLLRLVEQHPEIQSDVVAALKGLPASDLEVATVIKLRGLDETVYRPVLQVWKSHTTDTTVESAIGVVEKAWSSNGD